MTAPRYEVARTHAGFHARPIAANGKVVVWSESYTRARAAFRAVELMAGNPVTSSPFSDGHEVYRGRDLLEVREVDSRE